MTTWRARSATLPGTIFAIGICALSPGQARAGDIYMVQCSYCLTVNDFKAFAGATAAQRGMGGTYVVVGVNNPVTAYIRVTGTYATTCDPNGECRSYYRILGLASMTSAGGAAGTDADLSNNDTELFGNSRAEKLPVVELSPEYQRSFINSSDGEIEPGISRFFSDRNINPGFIKAGTIVTVKFSDGTKATYRKLPGLSTVMWEWTGNAWDKDGNPIFRNGQPVANTSTPGGSGGAVETSYRDREGANVVYSMTTSTKCIKIVSISVNGIRWGSWIGYTSCL